MLDHITIEVSDLAKSKLFYEKAFAPLATASPSARKAWAFDEGNGCLFETQSTGEKPPLTHLHVSFRVK
ncbi:MAG: VOC family protein, partial [Mesorhizobium sp.]